MSNILHRFCAVLALLILTFVGLQARANDYLEKEKHFSVYTASADAIHFKIPVWAYGKAYDYYANNAYACYQINGTGSKIKIFEFNSERYGENENKDNKCGTVEVKVLPGMGTLVITSMYDGSRRVLTEESGKTFLNVKQIEDDDCPWATILECDWYPPATLTEDMSFTINLAGDIYRSYTGNQAYTFDFHFNGPFNGSRNLQTPQLFDPYLNAASTDMAPGLAGVSFVTHQAPHWYKTSINPNDQITISDRSGIIYVPTSDRVNNNFYVDFNVDRTDADRVILRSQTIQIPAYHQIRDFSVSEEMDSTGTYTGNNILRWHVNYPSERDIATTDYFEVQRAFRSDYSDAKTIGLVPYGDTSGIYIFTDNSRDTWTGNLDQQMDTIDGYVKKSWDDYVLKDEQGNPLYKYDLVLYCNSLLAPSVPIYYRVRRITAAAYGWTHNYASSYAMNKHNYLAPLAATQQDYSLDNDFASNRTVHFNIKLENKTITQIIPDKSQFTLQATPTASLRVSPEGKAYSIITIRSHSAYNIDNLYTYIKPDGTQVTTRLNDTERISVRTGSKIIIRASDDYECSYYPKEREYIINHDAYLTLRSQRMAGFYELITDLVAVEYPEVSRRFDEVRDTIIDKMYSEIDNFVNTEIGKSMWDHTARLILIRELVENGERREFPIPADSIRRGADGNWYAHMTDVASAVCTHYKYYVRIDQSRCDLRLADSASLLPVPINGPDLYRNSAASIGSFHATQGTEKRGVLLSWVPTEGDIDNYILERQDGSEYTLLQSGLQESYWHTDAEPNEHYLYRITVTYTCNGITTNETATTTGWRSPYGSIAGRVRYEDGTGCANVAVSLTSGSTTIATLTTDANGAYFFDSILYGTGTEYVVTPTSQTAEFRFNNTSSGSATVRLTKNNCEVSDISFDNISAVRFSGRVLYKNSSIPVRDANLLLNGVPVHMAGGVVNTDVSGNFSIFVPRNSAFTLRAVKEGHTFEGDGYVRIDGDTLLTLSSPLDGVRLWDITKVRLAGRITGGLDQASLPLGFGLSRNNLGDRIMMVLELEGDNTSYIVRVPEDLLKDTLEFTVPHVVYNSNGTTDTVGTTKVHYQHKRIVIEPDPQTGEYCADLYPVKYKVTQANATGYATLFTGYGTSEVVDMSASARNVDTVRLDDKYITYNNHFNITYRTPIEVTIKQLKYGLEMPYYGEQTWMSKSLVGNDVSVPLATLDQYGEYKYLFGAPVFFAGEYTFNITAHEDYYYNNERMSDPDVVYIKNGTLKMHNGMRETTTMESFPLDENGSATVTALIDHVTYLQTGDNALHSLDFSVEHQNNYVSATSIRGYVLGARVRSRDFLTGALDTVSTSVNVLDVLRDPPGAHSYAYLKKGTTYKQKMHTTYNYQFGVKLTFKIGNNTKYFIGTWTGTGGGATGGVLDVMQQTKDLVLPIYVQFHGESEYEYEFKTTERIQTSSDVRHTGADADVYIGTTSGMYVDKADAFRIVDSASYELLRGQIESGTVLVVNEARDTNGKPWYLMRTEDNVLSNTIVSSFAYTQQHIINTIIPDALQYRNSLLLTGSREDAQAVADRTGKYVFWSSVAPDDENFGEWGYYYAITPEGYTAPVIDKVAAANKTIDQWFKALGTNEEEKISAYNDTPVKTISISGGVEQAYEESYNYHNFHSSYVGYPFVSKQPGPLSDGADGFVIAGAKEIYRLWNPNVADQLFKHMLKTSSTYGGSDNPESYIRIEAGSSKFDFDYEAILDFGSNLIPQNGLTEDTSKTIGYVLNLDDYEHLNINVYKARVDTFNTSAQETRQTASDFDADRANSYLFGSLIYRVMGGATRCPWEGPDSSTFYNSGTPMNYGTMKIENPQIVLDRHEVNNIGKDQSAYFNISLWNEIEANNGWAASDLNDAIELVLKLDHASNPNGAKVFVDGMPLADSRKISFYRSNIVNKTVEVQAGAGYDYDNICLVLASDCTPRDIYNKACFSVHYMPVSCPVNIVTPHSNWILNTLSPKDSMGYYLPVSIDGFDINYTGFDHIELQYKLSTQSDEAYVNLCSFYADDSLYNAASGTKAMITGGRIENIRFYGERDPIEQKYDLRAVSFCRHGNGFITKSSTVISGTKDTRPPRVFGEPEPANAILSVGENLKLRFNESIAGNYLDEDNNFQLMGFTNETGITSNTSLGFDGSNESYAASQVQRNLSNRSFSIDLIVKPASPNEDAVFFCHGTENSAFSFGKTADNRLYAKFGDSITLYSKTLAEPMTAFTRVIMTYNVMTNTVHFYAGTQDFTDTLASALPNDFAYTSKAELVFGKGLRGNMLEARIWTKALTMAEISATNMKYLTGYEKELVAYYRMNEGRGVDITDYAKSATLYTNGISWTLPKGVSLKLDNTQRVALNGNLMSRNAAQDETMMLWFRNKTNQGTIYSAGYDTKVKHLTFTHDTVTDSIVDIPYEVGTRIFIENGKLMITNDGTTHEVRHGVQTANTREICDVTANDWHHFVLVINRTYNTVSIYLDGSLKQSYAATSLSALSGDMYLGGNGFEGNLDEFIIFEQALPKSILEQYYNITPAGDEMGLMAYLPFEEQRKNSNGIMELVFSPNDQREFRLSNGTVINKVIPLITGITDFAPYTDKQIYAPVRNYGHLTKLNFDWSFNGDELLINLKMQDREINKQSIYVTVRDVEDLNGNPMQSPVMWTAYVDHNALKWDYRQAIVSTNNNNIFTNKDGYIDVTFTNHSGKRHQYTLESIPEWLSADVEYGSVNPTAFATVRLYFSPDLPVGVYSDVIYLTDEDGLSDPLIVEYTVKAVCPWDEIDRNKYPSSMSVCGRVKIGDEYDTDPNDRVAAFYRNECVGLANVSFDNTTGRSEVYITIYGNAEMMGRPLTFKLWRASTGKVLQLTTNTNGLVYVDGSMIGCSTNNPMILSTSGSETQQIDLTPGWNWISFNLLLDNVDINSSIYATDPWNDGDLIKSPNSSIFSSFSEHQEAFSGKLKTFDTRHVYMVYCGAGNTIGVTAKVLDDSLRYINLRGNGAWNEFPCLMNETTNISYAMSDYYENATPGDLLKSHDQFAYFSEERDWVGNLTAIRPGQGYLMVRLGRGTVPLHFYNHTHSKFTKKGSATEDCDNDCVEFHNPNAASNMTLIAALDTSASQPDEVKDAIENLDPANTRVLAYVGQELAGVARPQVVDGKTLFFITVSSDKAAQVTFRLEQNDAPVATTRPMFSYRANDHHGTPREPVLLDFSEKSSKTIYPADVRIYSTIGRLIGEIKDAQSEQQVQEYINRLNIATGVYIAVPDKQKQAEPLKLIKR